MRHPTFPLPRSKEQILLEMLRECMDNPLPFSASLIRWIVLTGDLPDGWRPAKLLLFAEWIGWEAEKAEQRKKDHERRN